MMENVITALVSPVVKHLILLNCPFVVQNQKVKKNVAFAKIKNLTELCHNIKATEEQSINDISFLVDNIILIAKENCKRCLN